MQEYKKRLRKDFPGVAILEQYNLVPDLSFLIYAAKKDFADLRLQGFKTKESYEIIADGLNCSTECVQQWVLYSKIKTFQT